MIVINILHNYKIYDVEMEHIDNIDILKDRIKEQINGLSDCFDLFYIEEDMELIMKIGNAKEFNVYIEGLREKAIDHSSQIKSNWLYIG